MLLSKEWPKLRYVCVCICFAPQICFQQHNLTVIILITYSVWHLKRAVVGANCWGVMWSACKLPPIGGSCTQNSFKSLVYKIMSTKNFSMTQLLCGHPAAKWAVHDFSPDAFVFLCSNIIFVWSKSLFIHINKDTNTKKIQ